jgi:hypothetical protein
MRDLYPYLHLEDYAYIGYIEKTSTGMLVVHILLHCYVHATHRKRIITPSTFALLVEHLHENWNNISHMHKHLVAPSLMTDTTTLAEIPNIVKSVAENILRELDAIDFKYLTL